VCESTEVLETHFNFGHCGLQKTFSLAATRFPGWIEIQGELSAFELDEAFIAFPPNKALGWDFYNLRLLCNLFHSSQSLKSPDNDSAIVRGKWKTIKCLNKSNLSQQECRLTS
jgi:hypothetical protein